MKNKILLLSFLLLTLFISSCQQQTKTVETVEEKNKLLGSWEVSEIHWITSDTTYSIHSSQPGIFMVDAKRYAIIWTPTREPRQAFEILSNPTDDELKSGFRSIVFNSGNYTITDSTITTTALVAKVPGFEGGKQFYRYTIKDDVLRLTMFDETYPNGDKPEWFGNLETEFVMKKVN